MHFDPQSYFRHRKLDGAWLLAAVLLGTLLDWNLLDIAIFAVFIWSIVGPIASRYLAYPALFFLGFVPILLLLGREERAEEFSIYAYYFFAMMVVRAIIEIRQAPADTPRLSR